MLTNNVHDYTRLLSTAIRGGVSLPVCLRCRTLPRNALTSLACIAKPCHSKPSLTNPCLPSQAPPRLVSPCHSVPRLPLQYRPVPAKPCRDLPVPSTPCRSLSCLRCHATPQPGAPCPVSSCLPCLVERGGVPLSTPCYILPSASYIMSIPLATWAISKILSS